MRDRSGTPLNNRAFPGQALVGAKDAASSLVQLLLPWHRRIPGAGMMGDLILSILLVPGQGPRPPSSCKSHWSTGRVKPQPAGAGWLQTAPSLMETQGGHWSHTWVTFDPSDSKAVDHGRAAFLIHC